MAEGLASLVSAIGQLKLAPDADMEFLTKLETAIIVKVKQATGAIPGGPPQMGQQMGADQAAGATPPPQGPPPGAQMRTSPQMPPVDEMRRMMAVGGS